MGRRRRSHAPPAPEKLRSLALRHNVTTDAGLAHVGRLTNLSELYLDGTMITAEGLAQLAKLTRLRELSLKETQ